MTSYDDDVDVGTPVEIPVGTLSNLLGDRMPRITPGTVTIREIPSGDYLVEWTAFRVLGAGHPLIREALEVGGVRADLESRGVPEDDRR